MVFVPEAFDFIGRTIQETQELSETLEGPIMKFWRMIANTHQLWLSLGGFHEKQVIIMFAGVSEIETCLKIIVVHFNFL